jgi:hypothetical protein
LLVLVVLAFAAPSRGGYGALVLVVIIWAILLTMSYPSSRARGMSRRDVGRSDFGRDAERKRR